MNIQKTFIEDIRICTKEKTINNGGLLFEDGIIRAVYDFSIESTSAESIRRTVDQVMDGRGMLAMPGLVNCHTHMFQTFLRGFGEGLPLYEWLRKAVWPVSAAMTAEDFYYSSMLGCAEAIKGGTTMIVDNHYVNNDSANAENVCMAIAESGIRGVVARGYANTYYHPAMTEDDETIHREVDHLVKRWHRSHNGRIEICPSPNSPVRCTPELLKWTGDYARDNGLLLHIHTAETETIRQETLDKYGLSNIRFMQSLNMLHPGIQLVHSVKVDEGEADIIKEFGGNIVHCPVSNMYLASGVAPVAMYVKKGINVALGSDGPASNNTQNMFETMKMAACQQRAFTEDANAITVDQAISMATENGAKACGHDDIGFIKEGAKADVILLDLNGLHMRPYHNAKATIVYSTQASDVDTVFVDGKMLMSRKKLLFVNEDDLISECEKRIRNAIKKRGFVDQADRS